MRDRFTSVVGDMLDHDSRTVVVLAVIGHRLFSDSGIEARHPDRIVDVGIREQTQIGVAAGLALEGYKPIATGFAPFLIERSFEQVKLDFHHQGTAGILASVGGSWDASGSGRTHQAPEDVALMASLRSWTVHVPGHPDELELLLRQAHATGERVYLRMTGDSNSTAFADGSRSITTLRRGSKSSPTTLAVGPVADDVLGAAENLDMTVLYTATPYPIDGASLRSALSGDEVYLVEPYLAGTSTPQVVEALSNRPMRFRAHGVRAVDTRRYGAPSEHRSAHGLDVAGIRAFLTG